MTSPGASFPPRFRALSCRACQHEQRPGIGQICESCWGPLDVAVDPAATPDEVATGTNSMWRFAPWLPTDVPDGARACGGTPLVNGGQVGSWRVWFKDETANPSGSFKDRLVATALAAATIAGLSPAVVASTGNLAIALAHAASRGGGPVGVIVPASTPPARLARLAEVIEGVGALVVVDASYDRCNQLVAELAEAYPEWAFPNVGLRAHYAAGAATVAWEILTDRDWEMPDVLVLPMASGASAVTIYDAFVAASARGWTKGIGIPALVVGQPAGCAPVAAAFAEGRDEVRPVRPSTTVESLAMGDPPDGSDVLARARASGGGVFVADESRARARAAGIANTAIRPDAAVGVALEAFDAWVPGAGSAGDSRDVVVVVTGPDPSATGPSGDEAVPIPGVVAPDLDAVVSALHSRWGVDT